MRHRSPLLAFAIFASASLVLVEPAAAVEDETPEAYLENALSLLEANHINRDRADWQALGEAARTLTVNADSPADTHAAIRAVIIALDEKHSYLIPPRPPRSRSGSSSGNRTSTAPPMPEGELLPDGIAYVSIPPLTTVQGRQSVGVQYRDVLQSLLEDLDTGASCGWIIDLRKNYGGNMWPMLNGLDPLLGNGPFGYFVGQTGRSAWVRTQTGISPVDGETASLAIPSFALGNADRPIAVLIGGKTTSSGEMVAVALIGAPNSRSFGQPTANFTTAVVPYELSDGAILGVTTSRIAFASGEIVEGAIQPDVAAEDDAQDQAAQWLQEQCSALRE
ncbi:MAG: S41 family peptidase [Erythrobacter sp.]|nr:S41 family peptidase [Erythrobacter sp.]